MAVRGVTVATVPGPGVAGPAAVHIGPPAADLASVTVVGPQVGAAGAYATAAFAMGPAARDWVESLDGYEALGILPDGAAWRTSGFAAYTAAR